MSDGVVSCELSCVPVVYFPPLGNFTNRQIYLATDHGDPLHAIIHLLNNKQVLKN